MNGERVQNVLNLMGQDRDAAHPDRIARAFQGVRNPPRYINLPQPALTSGQALDHCRKLGGLLRQFLQQPVQQIRIDISGQRQRHILRLSLRGPGRSFILAGG